MKTVASCANKNCKAKNIERVIVLTIHGTYSQKATQLLCPYCGDLLRIRPMKDEVPKKAS